MANEKLEQALGDFDNRKQAEAKKRELDAAAAALATANFDRYRAETLLPMLKGLKAQLEARGHSAEIVETVPHPPMTVNLIEMKFVPVGSSAGVVGASVVFLQRNGIEFITFKDRPRSLNFAEHRGKHIDPDTDSAEDLVVEFLKSLLS